MATTLYGGSSAACWKAPAEEAVGAPALYRDLDPILSDLTESLGARGAIFAAFSPGSSQLIHSYDVTGERLAHALGLAAERDDQQLAAEFTWQRMPPFGDMLHVSVGRAADGAHLVVSLVFDGRSTARGDYSWRRHARLAARYLRLWRKNAEASGRDRALEAALDMTETGILLVDPSARILFANAAAEELIRCGDGIARSHGILRPISLADAVNFHAALCHVTRPDAAQGTIASPLISFRRESGTPLVANLLPARIGVAPNEEQGALVNIIDPTLNTDRALSPLCRLYGLSPVETTLACRLAAGDTIATAAEKMRVKEQTARTYLKQIFIKTGAKRQTELIVLMLSRVSRMKRNVVQMALGRSDTDNPLGPRSALFVPR